MIATGNGFKRVIQGLNINSFRDGDGTILTGSTEPSREALETSFIGLVVSNNQTDLGAITFNIPRDYDKSVDKLDFRFFCAGSGTTDTITIDASIYRKRPDTALSADLDPTISGSVPQGTANADYVEVRSHGDGYKAGDAITVVFSTNAHTTDSLYVYGFEVVYASDLVYEDETDRSITDE